MPHLHLGNRQREWVTNTVKQQAYSSEEDLFSPGSVQAILLRLFGAYPDSQKERPAEKWSFLELLAVFRSHMLGMSFVCCPVQASIHLKLIHPSS